MKVAILTANTQVYKEQEEDKGGKVIRKIVEEAGQHVIFAKALPVDKKVLSTIKRRLYLSARLFIFARSVICIVGLLGVSM